MSRGNEVGNERLGWGEQWCRVWWGPKVCISGMGQLVHTTGTTSTSGAHLCGTPLVTLAGLGHCVPHCSDASETCHATANGLLVAWSNLDVMMDAPLIKGRL